MTGKEKSAETSAFLKDVFVCSLGAYGGPEAHFGVFLRQLVEKRRYLDEAELVELVALCSFLPGPTSTQTIVAVGYKRGGLPLALLTMLVWALPAVLVMTQLSFLYQFLAGRRISSDFLRFVGPMAVGFIINAAVKISRKVITGPATAVLTVFSAAAVYFFRSPWIFPAVLLAGGFVSVLLSREPDKLNAVRINPTWRYLVLFTVLAAAGLLSSAAASDPQAAGASAGIGRTAFLFESFYRYGYLVFGGGQVVVPMMQNELVEVRGYMTTPEFLTGYGLVQGLPGPMFSFAAYAGGMAARGEGVLHQLIGAAAGGVGIFLPGLLLIFFVYPVWEDLKGIRAVRIATAGINAAAAGLILSAAISFVEIEFARSGAIAATAVSAALLYFTKLPPPVLVLLTLAAGFIL